MWVMCERNGGRVAGRTGRANNNGRRFSYPARRGKQKTRGVSVFVWCLYGEGMDESGENTKGTGREGQSELIWQHISTILTLT